MVQRPAGPLKQVPTGPAPTPAVGPARPVAAIVVHYDAGPHLARCLASLRADGVERIIVADNSPTPDSRAVTESFEAHWLPTGGNLGYGRAANLGAASPPAGAADILVCNPDLELVPGCVAALAGSLAAEPDLGAVGPRLLNPDGTVYPSARTFPDLIDAMGHGLFGLVAPNNPFTRRYRLLDWDHAESAHVDWISGACLLVRRPAWDAVGGFDPAFFMYMEDVDLCWRLGRSGWKVAYQPAAEAVHVQGVSADQRPYRMLAAHHRSMWLFARRTTTGGRRAALPLVAAGLGARLAVAVGRRRLAGGAPLHHRPSVPAASPTSPAPPAPPGAPASSSPPAAPEVHPGGVSSAAPGAPNAPAGPFGRRPLP